MLLDESAWFAICFAMFVLIGYRPIKNSILKFLDEYIKQIQYEIDSAKNAKINAEDEIKELKEDLKLIELHRGESIKIAEIEIEKKFKERCAKFEKSLEYAENSAKERIDMMQKDAVKQIEKEFLERVSNLVSNYFETKNSTNLDIAMVSAASSTRQRK